MKNTPLRTSFRSAIQATDSTCKGCKANTAATQALGHNRPVILNKTSSKRTTAAACSRTLVMW